MKIRIAVLLCFGFIIGCNPGGNIIRTLRFVDLNASENLAYQQYPNEFSFYILDAVLKGKINGYSVDYRDGEPASILSPDSLLMVLAEIFYDDEIVVASAGSYLSLANLLSLDEIYVGGAYHNTNYVTFYYPGDVTPEGLDKQFCSVSFQDALDVLEDQDPPVVWFQYLNPDWGWISNEVFRPNYLTSNQLGIALIQHHLLDTLFLDDALPFDTMSMISSDKRYIFSSTISNSEKGEIYFQNDISSILLGRFTTKHLQKLKKTSNDSTWILPMALALELQHFQSSKNLVISENGTFISPISGTDILSEKTKKKFKPGKSPFKPTQKFMYRTLERIIHEDKPDITSIILDALRDGEITAYQTDSLVTTKQSGKFFDELVIEDLKNVKLVDQQFIEVALIVKEIQFNMTGSSTREVKGFGLVVPGKHVPEGFDRTLGYFLLEDLKKLTTMEGPWHGLPLQSGNIETTK